MTMEEQDCVETASETNVLQRAREELAHLQDRIGARFRRAEVRQRVGLFLQGLLASVERKNGWQLAEELGEHGPRGVQRLLGEAHWDEEAVRDDLRGYVVEHLGEENAVLIVDETGARQKGEEIGGSGTAVQRNRWQARKQPGGSISAVCQ